MVETYVDGIGMSNVVKVVTQAEVKAGEVVTTPEVRHFNIHRIHEEEVESNVNEAYCDNKISEATAMLDKWTKIKAELLKDFPVKEDPAIK